MFLKTEYSKSKDPDLLKVLCSVMQCCNVMQPYHAMKDEMVFIFLATLKFSPF